MIAGLGPYPAYEDSGVEGLGEVPAHWDVRRLGQIGKLSKGGGGSKDDESPDGIPCVRYGDLYTAHDLFIRASRSFVSADRAEDYTSIRFGDVLFAGSGETIDEIGKSAVNLMTEDACCGGDVILFRPTRRVDARFLGYATDCRSAAAQKATMGRGITVMHIYGSQLKRLALALPPLSEQTAIARFLDDADWRIKGAISAKEKRIALLEEQRKAIIHEVVTGQIDVLTGEPYPAYKDSGLDWLGGVPEHWDVRRLKTLCTMQSGDAITATSIEKVGEYPVFGGNGIRGYADDYTHDGEFVLVGRQGALCGNIHIARGRFWASEHAVVVTLRRKQVLEWCGALLEVMNLNQYSIAAAQPGLSVDRVLNLSAPVPSADEQARIGAYVTDATRDLTNSLLRTEQQVRLAQEFRTRLIADVVTGKLDVREAAARLPADDPPGVSATRTGGHPRPPAAGGAGLKTGGPFPVRREEHGG